MDKIGTVETNHQNILEKILIVGKSVDIVNKHRCEYLSLENLKNPKDKKSDRSGFDYIDIKYKDMIDSYKEINESYELDVIDLLVDYYDDKSKNDIGNSYGMFIVKKDYIGKLTHCINFIQAYYDYTTELMDTNSNKSTNATNSNKSTHKKSLKILRNLMVDFKKLPNISYTCSDNYDICVSCGSKMNVFSNISELICKSCGATLVLYGTVFEDSQIYNQEGQRSKHGCYDPSRHCKFWVHRIQARETNEIPQSVIDDLKQLISRDNNNRKLLCDQIRVYLKESGNTEYNDHIPLIRKLLNGSIPPQLTHSELNKLFNLFDKSVYAYDIIKPTDKSNTMYYPYIIYKILEFIIPNGMRKKLILECIHLQSRDTLIANDNLWDSVCKINSEISYIPTDRNDQLLID